MSEPLPEARDPRTTHAPAEPDREAMRKAVVIGWALFGLVVAIFAGTIGVALLYLAAD